MATHHRYFTRHHIARLLYLLTQAASAPGLGISPSIALKPHTKARKNPSKTAGRGAIATKELILHSSDHAKLDYTAREEEEAGGADALLKHYIGVFDPETGKLEVIEARKMVVRGSVRSQQATAEDRLSRVRAHHSWGLIEATNTYAEYERASKRPRSDLWYEEGKESHHVGHRKCHFARQVVESHGE